MQIYAWRKECQIRERPHGEIDYRIADASDVTTISRRDFLVVSTLAGIACGSDGARAFGSDGARAFGSDGARAFGSDGARALGSDGARALGSDGARALGSDGARALGSDGARAFQASDTTGSNAPRNGPEAD
jgi:hypothetical protein